jgi:hypothetical protein
MTNEFEGGYVQAMASCLSCNKIFYFNPMKVPSLRDRYGEKQPICKQCFYHLNQKRLELNLPEWPEPHPDAYTFCRENELD